MAATVYDSAIFCDAFGAPEMRAIFDDSALVARYVEVEVALAKVQGGLGIIPAAAAAEIGRRADASTIDLAKLKTETDLVGYPIVGVVHQLQTQCGDAGRCLHWGATTQDIMDTATALQVKAALALVGHDLTTLSNDLAAMADKHRATVMAGRTHLQHALPTTFGLKAAVWLAMVDRHRLRLAEITPRATCVEFGGAAGTLASLGKRGLDVADALARELKLEPAALPWHVARDGMAEAVAFLGLVTGTLGKIATDVMLMMQTEIGEVFEPFVKGRGSSSTMPQKRNPISAELMLAAARGVRQDVGLMLDSLAGADHERATGSWHLEWMALPRAFIATAGALAQAKFLAGGLVVDAARMKKNLDITSGLIVAEAVMMALAEKIGRGAAHDCVYGACRKALDGGTTLLAELEKNAEVTKVLDPARLEQLVDPAHYLGSASEMIDRALAAHRQVG